MRTADGNPVKSSIAHAAAKARGKEEARATADRFAADVLPIVREIEASSVTSRRGIARALNARGVQTARGGTWSAVQV